MFRDNDSVTITRAENGYIVEYVHQPDDPDVEPDERVAVFVTFCHLVEWLAEHWQVPTPPPRG